MKSLHIEVPDTLFSSSSSHDCGLIIFLSETEFQAVVINLF